MAGAIGAALLVGWTVEAVDDSATAHRDGVGGQNAFWRRPALVADLTSIPPGGVIVSNEPGPIWSLTGRTTVGAIRTTGQIEIDDCRDPVHLVWILTARGTGTEPPLDGDVIVDRQRWSIRELPPGACDR